MPFKLFIFTFITFSIHSSHAAVQLNGLFGLNGSQDVKINEDTNKYQLILPDFAGELLFNFKYIQLGVGSKLINSSSIEVETQNGNNTQKSTIESSFDFRVRSYYGVLSILVSESEFGGPIGKILNLKTFVYLRGSYGFDNEIQTTLGEENADYRSQNVELTTASLWMGLTFGIMHIGIDVGQRWLRIKELTEQNTEVVKLLNHLDTPYINLFMGLEF